jgi:hypothetical protein
VKAFYKNGDSLVIAQREFRREFGIYCSRDVLSAHAIKTWVRNIEATGSTLKTKGGSVNIGRTPDNIAVAREAIKRSSYRSACRHSVSLLHDRIATDLCKMVQKEMEACVYVLSFHCSCASYKKIKFMSPNCNTLQQKAPPRLSNSFRPTLPTVHSASPRT